MKRFHSNILDFNKFKEDELIYLTDETQIQKATSDDNVVIQTFISYQIN